MSYSNNNDVKYLDDLKKTCEADQVMYYRRAAFWKCWFYISIILILSSTVTNQILIHLKLDIYTFIGSGIIVFITGLNLKINARSENKINEKAGDEMNNIILDIEIMKLKNEIEIDQILEKIKMFKLKYDH